MPKVDEEGGPLEKHHFRFYKSDIETLRRSCGSNVALSKAIRLIVHKWVRGMEERANERLGVMNLDIEL